MTTGAHREDFLLPAGGIYALSHSVGCLPRASRTVLEAEFLQPWSAAGGDAWPLWLAGIDRFKEQLALLLGGVAADFSPQSNVSSALSKLLGSISPTGSRRTWVTHEDSFPSLGFVLDRAPAERRLLVGPADKAEFWYAALTDDVSAAVITHVHSNTGVVEPVSEICARCRKLGIVSIVDVAQSAGILPISLKDWGADVVVGSSIKWLCGGPGAGFMWIDPTVLPQLRPVDVGWFSHSDPFEFDIRHFEYAVDSRRFWGGTPSIAPYVLAAHGIATLRGIGIEEIGAHNRRLSRAFLGQLPDYVAEQLQLNCIGGTLCVPLGDAVGAVAAALRAEGHFFDVRGNRLRLSFHIYNDDDEARDLGRLCREALVTHGTRSTAARPRRTSSPPTDT